MRTHAEQHCFVSRPSEEISVTCRMPCPNFRSCGACEAPCITVLRLIRTHRASMAEFQLQALSDESSHLVSHGLDSDLPAEAYSVSIEKAKLELIPRDTLET